MDTTFYFAELGVFTLIILICSFSVALGAIIVIALKLKRHDCNTKVAYAVCNIALTILGFTVFIILVNTLFPQARYLF